MPIWYNFTMHAHRTKVTIPQNHEVVVRVPDEFPPGEAEVLVIATTAEPTPAPDMASRLERWIGSLPPTPVVPLASLDRGDLYR